MTNHAFTPRDVVSFRYPCDARFDVDERHSWERRYVYVTRTPETQCQDFATEDFRDGFIGIDLETLEETLFVSEAVEDLEIADQVPADVCATILEKLQTTEVGRDWPLSSEAFLTRLEFLLIRQQARDYLAKSHGECLKPDPEESDDAEAEEADSKPATSAESNGDEKGFNIYSLGSVLCAMGDASFGRFVGMAGIVACMADSKLDINLADSDAEYQIAEHVVYHWRNLTIPQQKEAAELIREMQ